MNSIDVKSIIGLKNINIIDIRSRSKYVLGHIPNAVNLDEYDLIFNTSRYLKKDSRYYIYCDYGNRSSRLVSKLVRRGYDVFNIEGGYHNYLLSK